MAQNIDQLVKDLRTCREDFASGRTDHAPDDIAAAVNSLDEAIAVLTNGSERQAPVCAPDGAAAMPNSSPSSDQMDERSGPPPYAIVAAEPGPPDELISIRGISSATALALSGLGITRFAHIAGLNARDVRQLHNDLGYRCTINRDNWIEQAALLASGGSTRFSRRGGPLAAADGSDQATPWAESTPMDPEVGKTRSASEERAGGAIAPAPAAEAEPAETVSAGVDEAVPAIAAEPESSADPRPEMPDDLEPIVALGKASDGEIEDADEAIPSIAEAVEPDTAPDLIHMGEGNSRAEEAAAHDDVFAVLPEPVAVVGGNGLESEPVIPATVVEPDPVAPMPVVETAQPPPNRPDPQIEIPPSLRKPGAPALEVAAPAGAPDPGETDATIETAPAAGQPDSVTGFEETPPAVDEDPTEILRASDDPLLAPIIGAAADTNIDRIEIDVVANDEESAIKTETYTPPAPEIQTPSEEPDGEPTAAPTVEEPAPVQAVPSGPETFAPPTTPVSEAEIVIVKDGQPEPDREKRPDKTDDGAGKLVGLLKRALKRR